ncbi:hypothetical protein [Marinimicrobium agarilyticum]|uniref:hypothetical protein n=1 Tax=Marinimicrobium agarilyticum TaxID=306546 RepID=UPI0004200050|nr:hypothetical protein [Marinimicrobium agarilyticum]
MNHTGVSVLWAAGLSVLAGYASANGGHFMVDDASITPPQNCEFETWYTHADPVSHSVVSPGCNFTGGSDWTLPVTYNNETDEVSDIGLEYKKVVWTSRSGPALAVSGGANYHRSASELDRYFVNVPLSFQLVDSLTLHLNGGVEHDRVIDDTYATWGVAATFKPVVGPVWILEMADNDLRQDPIYAGGVRTAIGSTRWTLDLGLAHDTQLDETAYTLGINIPRLF